MKKLQRVHANTHVVPLAEPDPIRVTRKVERPWKKRKGSGQVQKRDDTHAEIVEAQIKKAQARKARQKAGLSKRNQCNQKSKPVHGQEEIISSGSSSGDPDELPSVETLMGKQHYCMSYYEADN
jgi:hypothetical protein